MSFTSIIASFPLLLLFIPHDDDDFIFFGFDSNQKQDNVRKIKAMIII